MGRQLGTYLRQLRGQKKKARGLKQVAPEVGVSYSYLSKLENGLIEPSAETIDKLAEYYDVKAEVLGAMMGKLPADVVTILEQQPEEAIKLLRARFGK